VHKCIAHRKYDIVYSILSFVEAHPALAHARHSSYEYTARLAHHAKRVHSYEETAEWQERCFENAVMHMERGLCKQVYM
jgi:hypothetical protein